MSTEEKLEKALEVLRYIAWCQNCKMSLREFRLRAQLVCKELE